MALPALVIPAVKFVAGAGALVGGVWVIGETSEKVGKTFDSASKMFVVGAVAYALIAGIGMARALK